MKEEINALLLCSNPDLQLSSVVILNARVEDHASIEFFIFDNKHNHKIQHALTYSYILENHQGMVLRSILNHRTF